MLAPALAFRFLLGGLVARHHTILGQRQRTGVSALHGSALVRRGRGCHPGVHFRVFIWAFSLAGSKVRLLKLMQLKADPSRFA
jgi:hypothetical protein